MNKLYIGIDPGKGGGVAIIFQDKLYASRCPDTIHDMVEEVSVPLEMMGTKPTSVACIELVHSMPGNGVRSMFTFGQNYGTWLGIMATLKIPYSIVPPGKWMKHYGSMPKARKDRKNRLKQLAQQAWPDHRITLATADAILLAMYCKAMDKR